MVCNGTWRAPAIMPRATSASLRTSTRTTGPLRWSSSRADTSMRLTGVISIAPLRQTQRANDTSPSKQGSRPPTVRLNHHVSIHEQLRESDVCRFESEHQQFQKRGGELMPAILSSGV